MGNLAICSQDFVQQLTMSPVFFPNNDVSPLRRLRIQRAQEYGAIWAKTWEAHITHVIVDKGLMFQDVLKHLKLETFPVSMW